MAASSKADPKLVRAVYQREKIAAGEKFKATFLLICILALSTALFSFIILGVTGHF